MTTGGKLISSRFCLGSESSEFACGQGRLSQQKSELNRAPMEVRVIAVSPEIERHYEWIRMIGEWIQWWEQDWNRRGSRTGS